MKAKEEYEQISKLIDTEKDKSLERLINTMVSLNHDQNQGTEFAETSTDDDIRKRDEEHIAMTALLALRIKISCEIIKSNQSGKKQRSLPCMQCKFRSVPISYQKYNRARSERQYNS